MNKNGGLPAPDPGHIAYLIDGFLRDNLTETEHDELDEWIEAAPENMRLFEELTDEENLQAAQAWFQSQEGSKGKKKRRYRGIQKGIGGGVRSMVWYLAAACVIALGFGIYWFNRSSGRAAVPQIAQQKAVVTPGGNKGILTLANGRKIPLEDTESVKGAGFAISNGMITYTQNPSSDTGFYTLSVPLGQQLKVVLSDGSNVWLNAGTTLRYPVSFRSDKRVLELNGEGYFEVSHDPSKPFVVQSGSQEVTVLGTHFNITAYAGDNELVTTLLQGSVQVKVGNSTKILKPGEQSKAVTNSLQVSAVDIDEVTAWKEGLFLFRSAGIESVTAQLQRWYDLDIEYKNKPVGHFNATVKRSESLNRVLQVLEGTGYVHFKVDGRKLIVQP